MLQNSSLCDLVGVHGRLGTTKDLQSKLFDIGAGRHGICDRLIFRVLNFKLLRANQSAIVEKVRDAVR